MLVNIKVLAISIFTVCWYWSSSINAVATQRLLRQFFDPEQVNYEESSSSNPISLALVLTSSQLVMGGMLSMIFLFAMVHLGFTGDTSIFAGYKDWHRSDVVIGLLHYFGCLFTNIGFAYGSASLVQVIKLLEPIETLILTVLVHISSSNGRFNSIGEVVSLQKVFATLIIIGGTSMLLGQHSMALNSRSIICALASGFCMSSRNVLKKRTAATKTVGDLPRTNSPHRGSSTSAVDIFVKGMINFSYITIFAAIPAMATLFPNIIIGNISHKMISSFFQGPRLTFIQAVIFHCFYNIASISVLSLTSALVHSLLNVGKRIINVLTVAVVFGVPLSVTGKVGLMVAAAGTILYNKEKISQLPGISSRSIKLGLVFLLIAGPLSFNMQLGKLNDVSPIETVVFAHNNVEVVPLDMLATMAGAAPCEKTVVLDSQVVQLIPKEHDITGNDSIVCIQAGNFVGAAFYKGRVVHTSVIKDFLVNSTIQNFSYRIVERKEVIMFARYLPSNKDNNAKRRGDGNKGNFVWQYGATNLLNPYTTRFVESKNNETSVFILASANLFLLNKDYQQGEKMMMNMAQSMANLVVRYDLPSIMLGIGVQMEFSRVTDISTVNFDGYDSYNNLLDEIGSRQKSKSIAVRGDVTERICENSGHTHCLSMGCPSLAISRHANLGGALEYKWQDVLLRVKKGSKSLKVALALPALQSSHKDYDPAVDLLMSIFTQHDCYFIMQSDYDRGQLIRYAADRKIIISDSRILSFDDHVEPWFDFIKTMDFAVSFRIHGAMAAISNEIPAVVIPTDFRILELVNAMKLPLLPMEKTKEKKYESLLDIINDVSVDFDEFEKNRRDKLKQYKRILEDVGLEIDPALNAILNQ